MQIGYARVFPEEQTLAAQQDAITQASCERVFADTVSGSKTSDQDSAMSCPIFGLGHPRRRAA